MATPARLDRLPAKESHGTALQEFLRRYPMAVCVSVWHFGLTRSKNRALNSPGLQPEVYDNIPGGGADFWLAMAQAINQGQGPQRGPSQLIAASAGGATVAPAAFSTALGVTAFGTDGAADVTAMTLVGMDIPF